MRDMEHGLDSVEAEIALAWRRSSTFFALLRFLVAAPQSDHDDFEIHFIPIRHVDAGKLLCSGNQLRAGIRSAGGVGRTWLCSDGQRTTG